MKYTPLYSFGKTISFFLNFLMPHQDHDCENLPEQGRVVVCCNHVSMKDPVILALAHKRQLFYMAKAELFENKLFAKMITSLGAFPVQRGTGDSEALETAKKLLEEEKVLGIFIEGTREKEGKLLKPKSGAVILAYENNAPILPMCITAKDGKAPRLFHRTIVSCGKLIYPEELGIAEGSAMEYRRASRLVMSRISELRERDIKEFEK